VSAFTWTDEAVRSALSLRTDLADDDVRFASVCTDSRAIEAGDLYVALKGERFDGHDFVAEALARGAGGAVVSRPTAADASSRLYPVDDTLAALGHLALFRRNALTVPVVGITGSAGKTSTKDLTRAALQESRIVHATKGNLNNRIGMPLTLLAAPDEAEVVILEMGTNEPGEIAVLAAVARPDVAVLTTVGESHLEKLGSIEGVLEEKLALLRGMAEGGRCVVGDEPDFLPDAVREICPEVRVAGWSERADADLRPEALDVDHWGAHRFTWRDQVVTMPLPGRHAVTNAMLALAVADLLGVPPRDAARGLATAETGSMRGEVRRLGGLTLVVDCYNANPQSVRVALDLLDGQSRAGGRVAVLGTMLELGAESSRLHVDALTDALDRSIDTVVATGAFADAAEVLGLDGEERVIAAQTWQEAYPMLRQRLGGQEVVLLKASRGVALEGILPMLEADFGDAAAAGGQA
jgi:UDP-N-acetylmuramoyl-tripeptide--D-alanyl-D-alanine ligase